MGYPAPMKLAPRPVPTLATLVVLGVTARLGIWQVDRYYQSLETAEHMERQWSAPPLESLPLSGHEDLAHRRVAIDGEILDGPRALSAGGLVGGTPGYRLVVPFRSSDGPTLLVDLGWVPADATEQTLTAWSPTGALHAEGLLLPAAPPTTPLQPDVDGNIERWPLDGDRLWGLLPRALGPPYGSVAQARNTDVPWVIKVGERHEEERLEPSAPPIGGYALPLPKIHHRSYAAQWFAIGLLAVALWLWSSLRKTT